MFVKCPCGHSCSKMNFLRECKDMLGRNLSPEYEEDIKDYLRNPTPDNWSDISGVIICSGGKTIWQSVIAVDPTFPRSGRQVGFEGKVIKEWERIPEPVLVIRAIKNAIKEVSNRG